MARGQTFPRCSAIEHTVAAMAFQLFGRGQVDCGVSVSVSLDKAEFVAKFFKLSVKGGQIGLQVLVSVAAHDLIR